MIISVVICERCWGATRYLWCCAYQRQYREPDTCPRHQTVLTTEARRSLLDINITIFSALTRDELMGCGDWCHVQRLPGGLDVTQNLRIVLLFDRRVDGSSVTPPFPFWTFLYMSAQSRDCKIFLWTIILLRTYQRVQLRLKLRLNAHYLIV